VNKIKKSCSNSKYTSYQTKADRHKTRPMTKCTMRVIRQGLILQICHLANKLDMTTDEKGTSQGA